MEAHATTTPLTRLSYPVLETYGVNCILFYTAHVEGSYKDPLHPVLLDLLVGGQDVCRDEHVRSGKMLVIDQNRTTIKKGECHYYIGECPGRTVLAHEELEDALKKANLPVIIVAPAPETGIEEAAIDAVLVLEVIRETLWDGQMILASSTAGLSRRFDELAGVNRVRKCRRSPADIAWELEIYDVITPVPSGGPSQSIPSYSGVFIPLTRKWYTKRLVQSMLFWSRPINLSHVGIVKPHRLLKPLLDKL
ncbi:MAG: hypothetical protein F7C32_01485 [Desulfurococcales archaeon]|nr:hypothetical protein [Desulfurococcales archaeon]